jgi:hypothetical protein
VVVVLVVVVVRQRLAPWPGEMAGVVLLLLLVVVMDKWRRVGVELRRLDRRVRGAFSYGIRGKQQMHSS